MMAARRGSAISEDPHAKGMGMGKLGGKNPVISKKKWRQASARPTFDVHKYSPSIMVWSEAECNPWRRVMFKSPRDRSDAELDMLEATLTPKVEWLRRVVPPIRRDIFRRCRLERLRKSDVLFEQGDEGKAFYIILAGMVNVNVRVEDCTKLDDINMIKHIFDKGDPQTLNQNGQHTVNTIGPMQWFGGMALHSDEGCTRMASIVAIENTLLMAIPRSDYTIAVRAIEAEKSVTALETLRETPYFHSCPESALRRLAAASSIHEHAAGELVVCQDSAAHSLVIVIDGSLHVFRQLRLPLSLRQGLYGVCAAMNSKKSARQSQVGLLKIADFVAGDTLGIETILNQHHEYRFSLKAVTHCRVLTVPRNDVSALFGADPDASKSARKLSLMRLPSDESILRRASRSLNWNLFKVGLMTSISDKLRTTIGSKITVAQSVMDYRCAPTFDEEALDLVDEALMPGTVTGKVSLKQPFSYATSRMPQPITYNPHRMLRSVRGATAAEVQLPPSSTKPALQRLHGSLSTPALLPGGKSFRSSAKTLESWTGHDVVLEALDEGAKVPLKWEEGYLQRLTVSAGRRPGARPPRIPRVEGDAKEELSRTLPAALRSLRRARNRIQPHTAPLPLDAQIGPVDGRTPERLPLSKQHLRKCTRQKRLVLRATLGRNPILRKTLPRASSGKREDRSGPGGPIVRIGSRKRNKAATLPPPPKRSSPLMLRGIARNRPATRSAYNQVVRDDRVDPSVLPAEYASRKHENTDILFRTLGVGRATLGDENSHEEFVEAVQMGNHLSFNRLLHKVSLPTLRFVIDGGNGATKTSEAAKLMPRVRDMHDRRVAEAERAKLNMRLYGNVHGAGHTAGASTSPYPNAGEEAVLQAMSPTAGTVGGFAAEAT